MEDVCLTASLAGGGVQRDDVRHKMANALSALEGH